MDDQQLLTAGKQAIAVEQRALIALAERLDLGFAKACRLILAATGRVIVTGMGKSGHIGKKIAASLASTGTPAFFVHPGEAVHGDLGMIVNTDVVIAISNSGTNSEIVQIIPTLKRRGIDIIAMTGQLDSPLAQHAKITLDISVAQEACPLDLAPTASTTATLALGDALTVALLQARGFTAEDFALSHPGGKLGRTLLTRVDDIMQQAQAMPLVESGCTLAIALAEMTKKTLGMTGVVDNTGKLIGVYTDGDLRRSLAKPIDLAKESINAAMTHNPRTVSTGMLAAEALHLMQSHTINGLFVIDETGKPVGAFNMLNLLNAGLV